MTPPLHGPHVLSRNEISFVVWAPYAKRMKLEISYGDHSNHSFDMISHAKGYFAVTCETSGGLQYRYLINGRKKRPDPASKFQPRGVNGPSSVVFPNSFNWHDQSWMGVPRANLIIYEMHVGTFSSKGTFEAAIPYLGYLRDLGITAIELMPIAQFPGERNWGYDGVDLFAPQNSYGGPQGLKKLVDGCHQKELSVILDVVYNHVGPEGNYLGDFGPYFSDKYRTPWGPAVNYDESGSDEVRKFVVQNAVYWIEEFHLDGLRLDAVDKVLDMSPRHILLEIGERVHEVGEILGREVHVIAESDLNDPRIIRPKEIGGYSVDAQWADDFQHSVHSYLTGERFGYYSDFGNIKDIAKSLTSAFVYDGRYSNHRGRSHGVPANGLGGDKFVYCLQNHDQVGNRPNGERLSSLVSFDRLKVAVALLILSPSLPMLFMGEEYAEVAPFHYFVSHSGKELTKAVKEGRKKAHLRDGLERRFADPEAESTFLESKLDHGLKSAGIHKTVLEYYRDVIQVRNSHGPLRNLQRSCQEIVLLENESTIIANRSFGQEVVKCVFVLGERAVKIENPAVGNGMCKVFDSTTYQENSIPKRIETRPRESPNSDLELRPFSATVFAIRSEPR